MADELRTYTITSNGGIPHTFNRGIHRSVHPKRDKDDYSLCILNKAILYC